MGRRGGVLGAKMGPFCVIFTAHLQMGGGEGLFRVNFIDHQIHQVSHQNILKNTPFLHQNHTRNANGGEGPHFSVIFMARQLGGIMGVF